MQQSRPLDQKQEWLKQKINLLMNGQKVTQTESNLQQFSNIREFYTCLLDILHLPQATIPLQQLTITLVCKMFKSKGHELDSALVIQILFEILFSWKIPYQAKKIINSFLGSIFSGPNQQISIFFEYALDALIKLIIQLMENPPSQPETVQVEIKSAFSQSTFYLKIRLFEDISQVYHTIIILSQAMTVIMLEKDAQFRHKLVNSVRSLHYNLFNINVLDHHPELVKHVLQFWSQFNSMGIDHYQQLREVYLQISQWQDLTEQLATVYNYKSISTSSSNFNFLVSQDNEQLVSVLRLKAMALETHKQFLTIIYMNQQDEESLLVKKFANIFGSIFCTLEYMGQHFPSIKYQQMRLGLVALEILGSILEMGASMTFQEALDILHRIILPILLYEVENHRILYQQVQIEQFYKELEDCCDVQSMSACLPLICKSLELLVDKCQQLFIYLRKYVRFSLTKCHNIAIQNWTAPDQIQKLQIMPTTSCFLILSLLSYKRIQYSSNLWLKSILTTPRFFHELNEYDLVYLYLFLSYNWPDVYQNSSEGDFLIAYPLKSKCLPKLRYVGLSFIREIVSQYFSVNFVVTFIDAFSNLQPYIFKWQILSKLLKRWISYFSQCELAFLISNLGEYSSKIRHKLLYPHKQMQLKDTTQLSQFLFICRQISKEHDFIADKQLVILELFKIAKQIRLYNILDIDDQVIRIAGEVLQCTQTFPPDFHQFLTETIELFKLHKYHGLGYYQVFGACMAITKLKPNNLIMSMIGEILVDGLSYFASYQEQFDFNCWIDVGNILYLLQNLMLMHGDSIKREGVYTLNTNCNRLVEKIKMSSWDLQIVSVRNANLMLLNSTFLQIEYPFALIIDLATHSAYFNKYDCQFLLFVFDKIHPVFTKKQVEVILKLMLQIHKSMTKNKRLINKEANTKMNTIVHYVQPEAKLSNDYLQQCGLLAYHLKTKYLQLYNQFLSECYEFDQIFYKCLADIVAANQKHQTRQPVFFEPDGVFETESEEFKNSKKRRFLKVVGSKNENTTACQASIEFNIIPFKRHLQKGQEDGENEEEGLSSKKLKKQEEQEMTKAQRILQKSNNKQKRKK